MKEFIPIILIAALFCGLGGTLIAKSARKKSSYPLLIISGILAVLTFIGLIAAAIIIFFVK
ncbi:MAG: hypothetical protein IKU42_04635 [Oscillospiraceae bacterium]|nr:hypothetical protein [Oscillospiraceae bacterium]